MSGPIRFSAQKQQERISQSQFRERLTEFGWIPSRPDEDLGEDFLVHIYYQGRATGVTFHVQLKSVTNLHERRKDDFLVYDEIKVKDLKHWEGFSQPVVLVVWDVELSEGRWALVEDVIADLDRQRPKWRENKSKTRIYIPWDNALDDKGLMTLRHYIGMKMYPLIGRDKSFDAVMKLSFPNTLEGIESAKAFEDLFNEGEPIKLKGHMIREVEIESEWAKPWIDLKPDDDKEIILRYLASSERISVDINVISPDGKTASIRNVDLKTIKAGTKTLHLSNTHQAAPVYFHFIFSQSAQSSGKFEVRNWGSNVQITREILHFQEALAKGGKIQLILLEKGIPLPLDLPLPPQPQLRPHPQFVQLVDTLCMIQAKTEQFIQIPVEIPTEQDIQKITKLSLIIEYGHVIIEPKSLEIEFKNKNLENILDICRKNKLLDLNSAYNESYTELWGQKIQTGRKVQHLSGRIETSLAYLEKIIPQLAPDEYLSLILSDVKIIEIYPEWFIHEAKRLSQRLIENCEAEAVYLFGSLAWSDIHAPETDIDLAVRGLLPERYLEAVGYLERESNFPIDLVELEKVSDHLRERILAEGKLLSEREPAITPG